MLGSHFDLDREIARIASKRGAGKCDAETQSERIRAFGDFDQHIQEFVRSVGDDTEQDRADQGDVSQSAVSPAATRGAAGPLHQIR